jgi:DNA-binding response OmpR family regulator
MSMMISTLGTDTHTFGTVSDLSEGETRRSILIVERDPDLVQVLSERFAKEGYDVRIVSDGLVALNELRRSVPDAIVADVQSPGMSGIELAEELQDWGLPVVLISDSDDFPVLPGAAVLHKPLDIDEVVLTVEHASPSGG